MKTATEKENTMNADETWLRAKADLLLDPAAAATIYAALAVADRAHETALNLHDRPTKVDLADALELAVTEMQDAGELDDNSADLVALAQTYLGI